MTSAPGSPVLDASAVTEMHQALGPGLPDGLIGPVDSDVVIHVAEFTSAHAREAAALRQR